MKRVLFSIAILTAAAAPVAAQGQGRMAGRAKMMADSLVARLALTGDRETRVRSILNTSADQMQQVFAKYGRENREAMRTDMRKVQVETDSALATVLTSEEMAKYRTLQAELRPRGRPAGAGPGGPNG